MVLCIACSTSGITLRGELVPTGRTRWFDVETVQGSPGSTVTLRARLHYEVRDTEVRNKTSWLALANAPASFIANDVRPGSYLPVGKPTKTDVDGWASARYRIPVSQSKPSTVHYRVEFDGSLNMALGVELRRARGDGRVRVK